MNVCGGGGCIGFYYGGRATNALFKSGGGWEEIWCVGVGRAGLGEGGDGGMGGRGVRTPADQ